MARIFDIELEYRSGNKYSFKIKDGKYHASIDLDSDRVSCTCRNGSTKVGKGKCKHVKKARKLLEIMRRRKE